MHKSHSIYYRTLIIIVIALIIPMFIAVTVISRSAISTISRQSYNTNINLLQKTSSVVDTILSNVEQNIKIVCNDREIIQSVVSPKDENENFNKSIVDKLRSISSLNDYIHSVYLYRNYDSVILTSNGEIESAKNFHDVDWLEEWKRIFIGTKQLKRRVVDDIAVEENNCITLIRNIPYSTWSKIGCLVVNLDASKLYGLIALRNDDPGEIYVIDQEGDLILNKKSVSNKIDNYLLYNSYMRFNLGFKEIHLDSETYLLAYITSEYNYWKYVYVVPLRELQRGVNKVTFIIITVLLLYVFMAVGASLFISNKLYRPVKRLIEKYDIDKDGVSTSKDNEYQLIDNAYNEILNQNVGMQQELASISPLVREGFLFDLVTRMRYRKYGKEAYDIRMEMLDIKFPYKYFMVIIAGIDDYKKYIQNVGDKCGDKEIAGLMDFLNDLISNYYYGYCFVTEDDKLTIILNMNKNLLDDILRKELIDFVLEVNRYVENYYQFKLTFAVGNAYLGKEKIHCSYEEAITALGYKIFVENSEIIFIEDLKDDIGEGSQNFYEKNLLLINSLSAGSVEGVELIVDEIMEIADTSISYGDFMREVNTMLHLFLGFLGKRGVQAVDIFGENVDPYALLKEKETLQEIKIWINSIFKTAIAIEAQRNDKKVDRHTTEMVKYIEDNYKNDITLFDLAEHIRLSTTYSSKLFKDAIGTTFTDYLSRLRVNEAKKLLVKNELSIKEIGYKVGFNSIFTFLRTFKKYEKISPGQYRSII